MKQQFCSLTYWFLGVLIYSQRGTFHPILIVHTIDSQSSGKIVRIFFFWWGGMAVFSYALNGKRNVTIFDKM